jgi:hypothetical protein
MRRKVLALEILSGEQNFMMGVSWILKVYSKGFGGVNEYGYELNSCKNIFH